MYRGTRWLPRVRRVLVAVAVVGGTGLAAPTAADAHAMLIASDPAAGATVRVSPQRLRLLFSEPMDASLDRMTLVGADGRPLPLTVLVDPHDVHALVSPLAPLAPGSYRVIWRVVSVDGHVVGGSFVFAVGTRAADTTVAAAAVGSDVAGSSGIGAVGPTVAGAPLLAAIVRALAVGCLLTFGGLLLLITWPGSEPRAVATRLVRWLATGAAVLLLAHLCLWLADTAPGNRVDAAWMQSALATPTGTAELVRCGLVLLSLWALVLARQPRLALAFALGAIVASAFVGHAAAIQPTWALPAKAVHLLAAAVWLGGLAWLLIPDPGDPARYLRGVERVSALALGAVALVLVSGVVQTWLVSDSLGLLFHSAYGALVLAKLTGLGVLVGFGAYHRTRGIPALRHGTDAGRFRRSIGREMTVMLVVVLLAGWLAYVSPPMAHPSISTSHSLPEDIPQ